MLRISFHVLLFIAAFGISAGSVNSAFKRRDQTPLPRTIQAKFDYFVEHRDEFDLVFIGSSNIATQIDPAAFDAEMAKRGRPVRSFNFGITGLTLFEVDTIARMIIALQPERLRWCVLDARGWGNIIEPNKSRAHIKRNVWWHTPEKTAWAVRALLARKLSPLNKVRLVRIHIENMLLKSLPIGRAMTLTEEAEKVMSDEGEDENLGARLGFNPVRFSTVKLNMARLQTMNPESASFRHHEDHFVTRVDDNVEYRATNAVLIYDVEASHRERFGEFEREAYANLSAGFSESGVEPVYLVPPRLYLYDRYKPSPVMDFSDPKVHPALFSIRNRNDPGHLTAAAATRYSRMVARSFAPLAQESSKRYDE